MILADDLGYGDLGVSGHPTIRTPHLDGMAWEGARLTSYYSCAAVCSPARHALLTGRHPIRSGLTRAYFPREEYGIAESEITLADALRELGYATACIGKWHLGDRPKHWPTRHGFDYFFGLPYSNDMDARYSRVPYPDPLTLYRNREVVTAPVDQSTLTTRYTEEACQFIHSNRSSPFFIYLPHSMVHYPWFPSPRFRGKSLRGAFGDAVEEMDWSTGEILKTLEAEGLSRNTIVIFTSDNGATVKVPGRGSNGMLRGGKGEVWEGGMRVPFLARWPGRIPGRRVTAALTTAFDLFPTFMDLAGGQAPKEGPIDGMSIRGVLEGSAPSPRDTFAYVTSRLGAFRAGKWKVHLDVDFVPQSLFDLEEDPGERIDRLKDRLTVASELSERAKRFWASLGPITPLPPVPELYRR